MRVDHLRIALVFGVMIVIGSCSRSSFVNHPLHPPHQSGRNTPSWVSQGSAPAPPLTLPWPDSVLKRGTVAAGNTRLPPLIAAPPPGPAPQPPTENTAPEKRIVAIPRIPSPVKRPIQPAPGDQTWAIERIGCELPNEARVLFVKARVEAVNTSSKQVSVVPLSRHSLYFDAERTGFNNEERFCIPRRKFCWSSTTFEAFGGSKFLSGGITSLSKDRVAQSSSHQDLFALIEKNIETKCGISPR